jgi:hypothetical protein
LADPVAQWVGHLLEEAADITVTCPCCRCRGRVIPILDHALWYHGLSFSEAAAWLDADRRRPVLAAVNYLMSKERSARTA